MSDRIRQLTTGDLSNFKYDIDSASNTVNYALKNLFISINKSYNNSSITEDIALSKLRYVGAILSSAKSMYGQTKKYYGDDFSTYNIIDKDFPSDKKLFIDPNNKVMTLPVSKTNTNAISAVIIEPDSNGTAGNSENNFENADINAVIVSDNSSYFEYERFLSIYTAESLKLTATFKLGTTSIVNGIYIKMVSFDGANLALLDKIAISYDGTQWATIDYISDPNATEKFIRFPAKNVRYIKLSFVQDSYQPIQTKFGTRNRYAIGLRYIEVQSIEYEYTGEYVSIPFKPNFAISNVSFAVSDIAELSEIKYYISVNNGAKWIQVSNLSEVDIITADTGLPMGISAEQLRLKIAMTRTSSSSASYVEEILNTNKSGRYILKYKPITASVYIGGNIAYGGSRHIKHSISWSSQEQSKYRTPICTMSSAYRVDLPYVQYSDLLRNYITLKLNNIDITRLTFTKEIGGVKVVESGSKIFYNLMPSADGKGTTLLLDLLALSEQLEDPNLRVSGQLEVSMRPYTFNRSYTNKNGYTLKLPQPMLFKDKGSIAINTNALVSIKQTINNVKVISCGQAIDNTDTPYKLGITREFYYAEKFSQPITFYKSESVMGYKNTVAILVKGNGINYYIPQPNDSEETIYGYSITSDSSTLKAPTSWVVLRGTLNSSTGSIDYTPIDYQENVIWKSIETKNFTLTQQECKFSSLVILFLDVDKLPSQQVTLNGLNFVYRDAANSSRLTNDDFDIIDRNTISIKKKYQYPGIDYSVGYIPATDITSTLSPITNNITTQPSLAINNNEIKVVFDYKFQNIVSAGDIKYSSPLVSWYRVTLQ